MDHDVIQMIVSWMLMSTGKEGKDIYGSWGGDTQAGGGLTTVESNTATDLPPDHL
jgi:hypothetical protein